MVKPPVPPDENERIDHLLAYSVLDTLPEEDYDFITRMAAQICHTPIALVTLVDSDRQWFKSNHGLDVTETPREYSFCAHAINKPDKVMVVPDTNEDERFKSNPFVTGNPHVAFYAGIPLTNEDGFVLGTLCVIDTKPRDLDDTQLDLLKSLAKQVMNLLELRKKDVDLKRALKFLKFKNKELEEFTYITSHDLQEPIRTIISLIDILNASSKDKFDTREEEIMKYIKDAGFRMRSLILGLLDYSRLGKEKISSKVNCNDLIKEVQQDLSSSIAQHDATIDVQELPIVPGYKTDLRLLFQNLISNAIKFRKKQEKPHIRITFKEDEAGWEFCVADNGIGIPKKYRVRVFKIFQRLHSREKYEGYGLGLTHCRKIIELHNGKIWVTSEEDVGSNFYFTLPKEL